jgi:hypothetical protein
MPGAPVEDRLFFLLEPGQNVTGWRLRFGWVEPGGAPLAVTGPEGARLNEPFVVVELPGAG